MKTKLNERFMEQKTRTFLVDGRSFQNRKLDVRVLLALITGLAVVLSCSQALAQGSTWTNTSGGVYSNPANWFNNQVPPQGGYAYFLSSGSYAVEVDIEAENNVVIFGSANSEIQLDVSANRYTVSQLKIGAGAGTNNHLLVSGGLLDAATIEVAPVLGQGSLSVSGLLRTTYLVVGGQASFPGYFSQTPGGQGTLNINSGA